MPSKEYWDTCLFIDYLKPRFEERPTLNPFGMLLRGARGGDRLMVVSSLVLAEIESLEIANLYRRDVIRALFSTNHPYLRIVEASSGLEALARALRRDHDGLTPADAIHVATALSAQVDVLLTLDDSHDHGPGRTPNLLTYDGLIGSPPLTIREPRALLAT